MVNLLNQFFSKLRNYLDLPLFLRAIAVDTYNKLFGFVLDIKQSNELQIKLFGKESQLENVFVVFLLEDKVYHHQAIITIPHKNLRICPWL